MMRRILLAGLTFTLLAPVGWTQDPPRPGAPRQDEIKADEPTAQRDFNEFRKLIMGAEDAPVGERRKELTNLFSRWLIFRMTWPSIQDGRDPRVTMNDVMVGSGLSIDGIFKAIIPLSSTGLDDPEEARKRQRQREYQVELRNTMLPLVRQVLQTRPLIARVNAARVLHRWVEVGQLEVMEDVLKLLEDPNEHNAVKHWAVLTVAEAFNQTAAGSRPPTGGGQRFDVERAALALYRYLDALTQVPPATLSPLSAEEINGIRYLRRFAIRALGASHRPLVTDTKDKREGPIADLLIRIMNGAEGAVSPAASWEERVEAGAALTHLQPRLSPSYRPDFMLFQLAQFVVALDAKANEDGDRSTQRWRHYATILSDGLATMEKELPANTPAAAYFKAIAPQIDRVLLNVFDKDRNTQAASEMSNWLNDPGNAPKSATLFEPPLS